LIRASLMPVRKFHILIAAEAQVVQADQREHIVKTGARE
jgi:hypothetical protein